MQISTGYDSGSTPDFRYQHKDTMGAPSGGGNILDNL